MLPRQIFIACLCAGAVFATASNLPHPTLSHGLEIRQSTEGNCPKSFTAQNSLNFTTYCNQDNDEPNNLLRYFGTPSMIDCMNHCSRYQGNGEGCFGIVWKETTKNCWLKNSTTSIGTLVPRKGVHSAYVARGEMDGYDSACPKSDLSVNSLPGVAGLHYTTHCGRFIDGDDECFSGYPCLATAFTGIFHARSLEECLQICVDLHPLCRGVSYNPGLEIGFANCRPRTSFPETLSNPRSNMGIVHAATITRIDPIDQSCPSNKTYVASATRTSFEVRCGQLSMGSNITSIHTQNLTACMDACASIKLNCVGAQFDSSLAGGYNNCYLQNTTNVVMQLAIATYAAVSNIQQVPPNSTNMEGKGKSSSKAWIAGPVVGGVAAVAVVVFAIFWVRRTKDTPKTTNVEQKGHVIGELDPAGAVCEMDGGPRNVH